MWVQGERRGRGDAEGDGDERSLALLFLFSIRHQPPGARCSAGRLLLESSNLEICNPPDESH